MSSDIGARAVEACKELARCDARCRAERRIYFDGVDIIKVAAEKCGAIGREALEQGAYKTEYDGNVKALVATVEAQRDEARRQRDEADRVLRFVRSCHHPQGLCSTCRSQIDAYLASRGKP